jgi:hypothetical protein
MMCVREHASVAAFEEKQWFQPRRMGLFYFGGVCWSLSVWSLLLLLLSDGTQCLAWHGSLQRGRWNSSKSWRPSPTLDHPADEEGGA